MTDLKPCPSCREPLDHPSGDGCANMTAHKERAVGDDHLVWQLRNSKGWPTLGKAAADRIEALTSERDRWKDACRSASRDLNIVVPDNDRLKSERDAAEAKLARAVEALDEAVKWVDRYRWAAPWVDDAHATLAEIKLQSSEFATQKGESHE